MRVPKAVWNPSRAYHIHFYVFIAHKAARTTYNGLLETLTERVEKLQDKVYWMVNYFTANYSGAQELERLTIPLDPKEEDYNTRFWKQGMWQPFRNGVVANETDSPTLTLFMEDEFGRPISEEVKEELRSDAMMYWNGVLEKGKGASLKNYMDLGLEQKEDFRSTMENKYPWLRLCDGHWKTKQVWINYFSRWRDGHMPQDASTRQVFHISSDSPTPVPAIPTDVPSVPTHVPDVPKGPTPGSNNLEGRTPAPDYPRGLPGYKRRRDIDTTSNQGPSKKQKGKMRDTAEPAMFHHARSLPRSKLAARKSRVC